MEKPWDGGYHLNGMRDHGAGRKCFKEDEYQLRARQQGAGLHERAGFTRKDFRVGGIGAHLDEQRVARGAGGVKIDFVSLCGAEVVDIVSAIPSAHRMQADHPGTATGSRTCRCASCR